MDQYEPFWNKDTSGAFCLLFPNKFALSIEEIKDAFSKFGNVITVTATGDERGHRFVKFTTLSEAIKAIDGIKGHKKIKLIAYKAKTTTQKPQEDNKHGNKRKEENVSANRNVNHQSLRQSSKQMDSKPNNVDDATSTKSTSSKKEAVNQRYQKSLSKPCSSKPENIEDTEAKFDSDGMPGLETIPKTIDNEIPDLVKPVKKKTTMLEPKTIILEAKDVVVGNIHPNFGAAYILHLFDLYDPIAISYINLVPNTNIRYCHVYFKSINEVIKVEDTYNDYDLDGQKLIVKRPARLMTEAAL